MFIVKSFNFSDKELAEIAFAIRDKVFVQEQKVDKREEYDQFEEESIHYLIYDDEMPIGTARWRKVGEKIKLERFAILTDHRKKGAGIALVNAVLNDVLIYNKPIYLNSQVSAMNLYRRAGFAEEGELFYEANIPHYKMTYQK
jgi:predicted GNAT family N-acyltransferase